MDICFGIYLPSGLTLTPLTIQSYAFNPSGMMKQGQRKKEQIPTCQGTSVEKGDHGSFPQTPAQASTDPLSPPGWLAALPGAQKQSLRQGDRTPRFLAPPHTHAPVSLVTPKGGGSRPPSWEREGEKV